MASGMTKRRKPSVSVVYRCRGCWDVWIDGPDCGNFLKSIIVASYQTRAAASIHAKSLRAALGVAPASREGGR